MEHRFGIKDLFQFLFLIALLVMVGLAMKQYDRQWDEIRALGKSLDGQRHEVQVLQDKFQDLVLSGSGQQDRLQSMEAALQKVSDALARPQVVYVTPNTTQPVATRPATAATSPTAVATTTSNTPTQVGMTGPAPDPFVRLRKAKAMPGYSAGDWVLDAFGNGIAKLTPLLSGDLYATEVQNFVIETLADRDPDTLDWRPWLASGWEVSGDGLEITFRLRDRLRFSDGEPLTVDDVVFSFEFIMNEKVAAPRQRAYYDKIKSVQKVGPSLVKFTFKEPYFQAFELAGTLTVLPKHFYGKFTPEQFNNSVGLLMGSGPYRMPDPEAWKPGQLIQLVRNDQYWGVRPAFDRLVFKEITNDVAHLTAFRNGDIDTFPAAPEQYVEMLKDQALVGRTQHFEYQNPVGGYRHVAWNEVRGGKPTRFADRRVRQAMTLLVDRQRMLQEISLGYGVLATGPFSPLSKQYDPEIKPWPHDPERAMKLLAEAGFKDKNDQGVLLGPDGQPFEFKLTYPAGTANYEKMALFLKDVYQRAGIRVIPDAVQWAAFTDKLNHKDFEAISLGWSGAIEDDPYQIFHSSQMVEGGDDFISYKNEELDKTIEEARRTIDESKRMLLWRKCHRILHEDQPYMFLWFGKSLVFLDQRIKNVQVTKMGLNQRVEWFVPRDGQKWEK